jgi:hypothetical protein
MLIRKVEADMILMLGDPRVDCSRGTVELSPRFEKIEC